MNTPEEILAKHEWMPNAGWTKEGIIAAMKEYAAQSPPPIQGREQDIGQDLKELDASFEYLCKMDGVKDAGHRWIEFTDKWTAFKKKYLQCSLSQNEL